MDPRATMRAFIAERFLFDGSGQLDEDRPLFSSGAIDSFAIMELVLKVEEVYGVSLDIPALVEDQVDTFKQLETTIERLRGAR